MQPERMGAAGPLGQLITKMSEEDETMKRPEVGWPSQPGYVLTYLRSGLALPAGLRTYVLTLWASYFSRVTNLRTYFLG